MNPLTSMPLKASADALLQLPEYDFIFFRSPEQVTELIAYDRTAIKDTTADEAEGPHHGQRR